MKKIAVLGSTGSIGTQALDVAERYPDEFSVAALSCGHNIALLREQIRKFSPAAVCVAEEKDAAELAAALDADALAEEPDAEAEELAALEELEPPHAAKHSAKSAAKAATTSALNNDFFIVPFPLVCPQRNRKTA